MMLCSPMERGPHKEVSSVFFSSVEPMQTLLLFVLLPVHQSAYKLCFAAEFFSGRTCFMLQSNPQLRKEVYFQTSRMHQSHLKKMDCHLPLKHESVWRRRWAWQLRMQSCWLIRRSGKSSILLPALLITR
jgi:hypothetical protein